MSLPTWRPRIRGLTKRSFGFPRLTDLVKAFYNLDSFHESNQSWISDKGAYTVKFAASVEDVRAQGTYKLAKEATWKVNDVLKPDMELK